MALTCVCVLRQLFHLLYLEDVFQMTFVVRPLVRPGNQVEVFLALFYFDGLRAEFSLDREEGLDLMCEFLDTFMTYLKKDHGS